MKKQYTVYAILAATLILPALLTAQKANVVYVEGSSQIKSSSGSLRPADFGSTVTYGESVITGRDGFVEMTLENGSTIRVAENSVFSYSSTGAAADSRPVLATTAGKVSYKLNKAAGRSPLIQSNSMVAGVRGTEFTVFSACDGSTLLAVTDGIVDVESQGTKIELVKDEAVEVTPGKAPGTKFTWLGKELDYSSWNKGKNDEFIQNPLACLDLVATQLDVYKSALESLKGPYEQATITWQKVTDQYKALVAEGDKQAMEAFRASTLYPAQDERSTIILNIRYFALNYLSMRRYVMSNMYMEMKSRYLLTPNAQASAYFTRHAEILSRYEAVIVPQLNENDY